MVQPEQQVPARVARALLFVAGVLALWSTVVAGQVLLRSTRAVFLDVGDADCAVVHGANGRVLVIGDGGERGERVLLPYLLSAGVRRVDALIVASPLVGGPQPLLRLLAEVPVDRLLVSPEVARSAAAVEVMLAARGRGAQVLELADGLTFSLGRGTAATVVTYLAAQRAVRCVNIAKNGNVIVVGCGVGDPGPRRAPRPSGGAGVLKLPDCGRGAEVQGALVRALRPRVVVISADGARGRDSPSPALLRQLFAAHIPLFRTDADGAVTVALRGAAISVNAHAGRRVVLSSRCRGGAAHEAR